MKSLSDVGFITLLAEVEKRFDQPIPDDAGLKNEAELLLSAVRLYLRSWNKSIERFEMSMPKEGEPNDND